MRPADRHRTSRTILILGALALAASACAGRSVPLGLTQPDDGDVAGGTPVGVTVDGGVYTSDADGCAAPECEIRHSVVFPEGDGVAARATITTVGAAPPAGDHGVTVDCGSERFEDATAVVQSEQSGDASFELDGRPGLAARQTGIQIVQRGGVTLCVEIVGTWTITDDSGTGESGGWTLLVQDGRSAILRFTAA